jgi:uncharacterized membrane protein HdeD (DUF308 family)
VQGVIIGCLFVFSGVQQLILAAMAERLRWLWAIFGGLMLIAGLL